MKKYIKLVSIIISFMLCFTGCLDEETYSDTDSSNQGVYSRELRTKIKGNGEDIFTIMVYMCGSDLEEENGAATADIEEMLDADISDNVNLIIETGGARKWQNGISGTNNQLYEVRNHKLNLIENLQCKSMSDKNTLSEFLSYCSTNYPADRYGLIMWDHGGGAISGYGVDSNFPDESMEIYEIGQAIKDSGVILDFTGFDACLMGTIETGLMLEEFSDYMIASEETEPACGWYYTDWLSMLSENTSVDTETLSRKIIDDYISKCDKEAFLQDATLSLINLRAVNDVYDKLCIFAQQADEELANHNYEKLSKARSKSKSFAEDEVDHIDLVDFADNADLKETKDLINAVDGCVEYNGISDTVDDANGLSMYFPYSQLEYFSEMNTVYRNLKLNENYTKFMNRFVNIMAGGQENYNGNSSPMDALGYEGSNGDSYSDYDWYDSETINEYGDYSDNYSYENLEVTSNGEDYVLELTDEDWDEISEIEMQVLYDDGSGYLDLGLDNLYESDDDGNLLITYDNTWVSLNGMPVSYYNMGTEEKDDGSYVCYGEVPAYINDKEVSIVIAFSNQKPEGQVLGYTYDYEESAMCLKGIIPIKQGDRIQYISDYYTYDGDYEASYLMGDEFTADSNGLSVSYEDIGEGKCLVYYKITDLYGNEYWTEPVEME